MGKRRKLRKNLALGNSYNSWGGGNYPYQGTSTKTNNMDKAQSLGSTIGVIGAIGQTVMGFVAMREASNMTSDIQAMETTISNLEKERPDITNIYDDITDTSGYLSNEYANLAVATQATKNQQEEVDVSLANSLDTLRAMGAGAGAATSMALASMKSKQSISQSLEQQEVANQKLRAQGEMAVNQAKMAEAQRLQQAGVQGEQWLFTQQDQRKMQEMNRAQALLDQERTQQMAYQTQAYAAFGGAVGGLGQVGGALIGGED
jgi:hypothetical protein